METSRHPSSSSFACSISNHPAKPPPKPQLRSKDLQLPATLRCQRGCKWTAEKGKLYLSVGNAGIFEPHGPNELLAVLFHDVGWLLVEALKCVDKDEEHVSLKRMCLRWATCNGQNRQFRACNP